MELVKREFKQTKGEMVFNKSQYAGKIASIFFTLLLHCNVNSDVIHASMLLGKWIIQVSLMLFCGFKKTNIAHHNTGSKKCAGTCQSLDTSKGVILDNRWFQLPKAMQPSSGHLSQSILSQLGRSKRVYLEGFYKGSEGPSWYKCLLLLPVLFKNIRREAFQNRSSASIPRSPSKPSTAVLFKQSVKLASRKGVREKAELPHMVLFASSENGWRADSLFPCFSSGPFLGSMEAKLDQLPQQ